MNGYRKLWEFLQQDGRDSLRLTFDEIAAILERPLNHDFLRHKKDAVSCGYTVEKISIKERHVAFRKLPS